MTVHEHNQIVKSLYEDGRKRIEGSYMSLVITSDRYVAAGTALTVSGT